MKLTEKEIMYILKEAKILLTEDQEGDSIKKAIALYMDRMGCNKKTAEKFVRIDLREDLPNLRYKKPGKFILGVTRMFLDGQLRQGTTIEALNTIITYVASDAHYNEYDKNLNGLTANELISRFADAVKADAEADKERLAQQEYNNNNEYDVVRVDNFNETSQYRQYCYPADPWCITKYPDMLDSYTNNGIGQFYFCLKKGFEEMEPIQGENCPLDEYGISMFAVCVDGKGRLKTSTCRWNHSNGGNDHILTTEQISKLIGRNFYDVFKPNNKWAEKIENISNRLKSGEKLTNLFDSFYDLGDNIFVVRLDKMFNFVDSNTKEIISDKWFDAVENVKKYNFIMVKLNDEKCFFSVKNRQIYTLNEIIALLNAEISELLNKGLKLTEFPEGLIAGSWKTYISDMIEVRCFLGLYNIIENNKLKFKDWYGGVNAINHNDTMYYRVSDKDTAKYYYINENEENIFNKEWDWMSTIIGRYDTITVSEGSETNVISMDEPNRKLCKRSFSKYMSVLCKDKNGKFIFSGEDENGVIICDENGKDLYNIYFDNVKGRYSEEVAYCTKNNKVAVLFYNDFTMSEWFDDVQKSFVTTYNPFTKVYSDGKENLLNCITKQLISNWYDAIIDLYSTVYIVRNGESYNLLSENDGELLSDVWFKKIEKLKNNYNDLLVTDFNGKQNVIEYKYSNPKNWSFRFKKWYDKIQEGESDIYYVEDNGEVYEYNKYGLLNNERRL